MRRILLGLLIVSPALLADDLTQTVTPSIFYSTDSDNFDVIKVGSAYAKEYEKDKTHGVKYENAKYKQDSWSETIDAVSYTFTNKYADNSSSFGNIGIDTNSQLIGGAEYEHPLNANFTTNVFVERQIVDSKQYIIDETYYNMVGGVISYDSLERFSAAFVLADQYIEDGNNRIHFRSRFSYTLLPEEGIHAHFVTKHFTSSEPTQGDYFNPENYDRYMVGLSKRRWFNDGSMFNIGAYVGPEYVDGISSTVQWYEMQYTKPLDKQWSLNASAGALVNSNSYDYRHITFSIAYAF